MAARLHESKLPLLIVILFLSPAATADEPQTLLKIKDAFGNPPALSSWTTSPASDHCQWFGIKCSASSSVISISLQNLRIAGTISADVCDLPSLQILDLTNNSLSGSFPGFFNSCSNLTYLDISGNYFIGLLPADFARYIPKNVETLNLGGNNFTGLVPWDIGKIQTLRYLHLDNNIFNGTMPESIGDLTSLVELTLAYNNFLPAAIPQNFAKLTNLRLLWISNANLVGRIPDFIASMSAMSFLDLSTNALTGEIPAGIWQLKNLTNLYLFKNNLVGNISIDGKIGSTAMVEIDLSRNQLSGPIPAQFSALQSLKLLYLYFNQLSGEIPASIGLLPLLEDIRLFNNQLTGMLPAELGGHSPLWNLEVDDNFLSGEIPANICAGGVFSSIVVFNNNMTGPIPESLITCSTIDNIQIQNNHFSGELPASMWSRMEKLTTAILNNNELTGTFPATLLKKLNRLEIQNNRFSGSLPSSAVGLQVFLAFNNLFTGELPALIADGMPGLQKLNLSGNGISGPIPDSIGRLRSLTSLDLSRNHMSSQIPNSIGSLPVLTWLDLSVNNFSGRIPATLSNLKLNFLNVSSNDLSGEIPASLQMAVYDGSFSKNPLLCTTKNNMFSGVQVCSTVSQGSGGLSPSIRVVLITVGVVVALLLIIFAFFILRDSHRPAIKKLHDNTTWNMTKFHLVPFTEVAITRGLSKENIIGRGGSGEVYRVSLAGGVTVAVKKVHNVRKLEAEIQREFEFEVKFLGSIRHANIVKLLCCISSTQTKLLVYEYMGNGSLDRWLHREVDANGRRHSPLDWSTRVRIAIDAARGLCYMHHDCSPAIVHRDVKSNNILLDEDFGARIADFGLARMLRAGDQPEAVSAVAGSFGYMAPESGYRRKVSEKVDVYSFGVVLLELATGLRASAGGKHDGLANWALRHVQRYGNIGDVIDESIRSTANMESVETMFKLGLVCTSAVPSARPTMKEALQALQHCAQQIRMDDRAKVVEDDFVPMLQGKSGSRRKGGVHDDHGQDTFFDCNV